MTSWRENFPSLRSLRLNLNSRLRLRSPPQTPPHYLVAAQTLLASMFLSGHVATKNGTGGGGIGLCVRRIGDNGAWQELEVGFGQVGVELNDFQAGVGNGLVCGAKANRRLGSRTFVTMAGSAQFAPRGLRPELSVSLGHQLDQHTMGYLTYSTKLRLRNHDDGLELEEEESGMCSMLVKAKVFNLN